MVSMMCFFDGSLYTYAYSYVYGRYIYTRCTGYVIMESRPRASYGDEHLLTKYEQTRWIVSTYRIGNIPDGHTYDSQMADSIETGWDSKRSLHRSPGRQWEPPRRLLPLFLAIFKGQVPNSTTQPDLNVLMLESIACQRKKTHRILTERPRQNTVQSIRTWT